MTSPAPLGTAIVQIRATVDKVKDDITKGVNRAWKEADKQAASMGRSTGKKWGMGFNAGLGQSKIADNISRQFRDAERAAGISGAAAGRRYASAFNLAVKSANPPNPTPQNTRRTVRTPRTTNDGGNAGGGGGSPGAGTGRAAAQQAKNVVVTRTIRTVLDDRATGVLRQSLGGIQQMLSGITTLSKGALAGLGVSAALSGVSALTAAVSQLGGALLLLPAAVNAIALPFAAIKLGTSGIMDAFKAASSAGENVADTAKAVASASKGVVTAQRGIQTAQRGVESSERGVASAVRGTERARESLNDTIKDQIRQLRDLNIELKGSALDEEDATLAVERARERLANMPSDSTALDYKEANLAIRQAQQRLDEVRVSNADLRIDVKKANAEGVDGSNAVKDARQGVVDAVQNEKDANQQLLDSQQALTDANENLADAITAVQDAANSGGVDEYQKALDKLSPSAQDLVKKLFGLKGRFDDLKKSVQERLFSGLADDVVNLAEVNLPVLDKGLGNIAGGLNGVAKQVISAFAAPDAVEKFSIVFDRVGEMLDKMGPGFFALVGVFKNLATVGSEFFGGTGEGFTTGAQKLEVWSQNFDNIRGIMQRALDVGKTLFSIVGTGVDILKNVFSSALVPGQAVLGVLGSVLRDVDDVSKAAGGEGGALSTFFNNGAAAMQILEPGITNVVLGIGDILGMLAGLGVEIAPGLVDFIAGLREGINNLQPAFDYLGPKISEIFSALSEYLPQVGTIFSNIITSLDPVINTLVWLIDNVLPPLLNIVEFLSPAFGALAVTVAAAATAWVLFSGGMKTAKFFEDGLGGVVDKVKNKLTGQKNEQDTKTTSSEKLGKQQKNLADDEEVVEDKVDSVTDAIKRNTDATDKASEADPFRLNDGATSQADKAAAASPKRASEPSPYSPIGAAAASADAERAAQRARDTMPGAKPSAAAKPGEYASFGDEPAKKIDDDETPKKKGGVRGALGAIGGASLAGTGSAALVATGVQDLGGIEGITEKIGTTFEALKSGDMSTVLATFSESQDAIGNITEGFSGLKDQVFGTGSTIKDTFSKFREGSGGAASSLVEVSGAVDDTDKKTKNADSSTKKWNITQKLSAAATKVWSGVQFVLNQVMKANPIILIVSLLALLVGAIVLAYQNSETFRNIVQTCWEAIQTAISFAWNSVIKPVWDALLAALRAVGDFFVWVWNDLIKPAWSALSEGIKWYWENVIGTAFDALKFALGAIGDFFKWVWESVIQPAWKALGDGIAWVWDNVIKPAFDFIKSGLQGVGDFFGQIVGAIETTWNKVIDIVKKPVKFVVDTVYNKGIVPAWNGVAGLLGMDDSKLEPLDVSGFAKGGVTGVMSGYSPGRDDRLIAVGGGEAVMRPEFTRAVGPDWVDTMNGAARNGGVGGVRKIIDGAPAYATGGTVQSGAYMTSDIQRTMWDAVRTAFPNASLNSGTRTEDVGSGFDNHMGGTALDLGGPMPEIARWIYNMNGASPVEELIHWPLDGWQNLKKGSPLDYGSGTNEGHRDHVHWAMRNLVGSDGKMVSSAGASGVIGGGDDGGGLWDQLVGAVRGTAAWGWRNVMKPVRSTVEAATDLGGGKFGDVPLKMFDKVNSTVEEFIKGKEGDRNGGSSAPGGALIGSAAEYRPLVERLFREKGIPMEGVDKYLYQLQRESTFNPNAINLTDDNAVIRGTPSKGIAQVIDPTFDSYKDPGFGNIWDAESNIRASLNYLMKDPKFGGQGINALTGAGYDNGGWLKPGLTLANNQSGVPEPVFTGQQWDVLKQGLNQDAGNKYLSDNLPSLQTSLQGLAVDAFKETVVGGLFGEDSLGIDGLINKAVDYAVAEATKTTGGGAGQPPVSEGEAQSNAGIVAQEVNFYGMDPNKVGDEVQRAVGAGMTPVSGRYRAP